MSYSEKIAIKYHQELKMLEELNLEPAHDSSYKELISDAFLYIGQLDDSNKPHGLGFLKYKKSLQDENNKYKAYIGQWKHGYQEGQGSDIILSASGIENSVE